MNDTHAQRKPCAFELVELSSYSLVIEEPKGSTLIVPKPATAQDSEPHLPISLILTLYFLENKLTVILPPHFQNH
jgi:hypothetical protein